MSPPASVERAIKEASQRGCMDRSCELRLARRSPCALSLSVNTVIPVVGEIPTPEPGAGQVLLRMRAAGMNPMDGTLASGAWRPARRYSRWCSAPMVRGWSRRPARGRGYFPAETKLFGQLLIAPLGSAGTYAEYVAVTEEAPLARVPDGLDPVVAAALPTAGGTGLALVASLKPLAGKTVLIVGAGGGAGPSPPSTPGSRRARHANASRGRRRPDVAVTALRTVATPRACSRAHFARPPDGIQVPIALTIAADGSPRGRAGPAGRHRRQRNTR